MLCLHVTTNSRQPVQMIFIDLNQPIVTGPNPAGVYEESFAGQCLRQLAAGWRDDVVHAQVYHGLSVMIEPVPH